MIICDNFFVDLGGFTRKTKERSTKIWRLSFVTMSLLISDTLLKKLKELFNLNFEVTPNEFNPASSSILTRCSPQEFLDLKIRKIV